METQTQIQTKKRGGAKTSGGHLVLLIASTLLLTLAGIFLIMGGTYGDNMLMNVLGIITMVVGIALRYIDTRI